MEQWFKIAFSVFLFGYLQGNPIMVNLGDLGFELLEVIPCGNNVTFTSPTNVEVKCHRAALDHFTETLRNASNHCTDDEEHIYQTVLALERFRLEETAKHCNFTMKNHKNFKSFVSATKTFVQQLQGIHP